MSVERTQVSDHLEQYRCALSWLSDLCGAEAVQRSRFGVYSRTLRSSEKLLVATPSPEFLADYFAALEESSYLCKIFLGLASHEDDESLRDSLIAVLRGNPDPRRPGHDRARNKAFELSIAARIAQSGADIDLSDVTDVIAVIDGNSYLLECKRPEHLRSVGENVSEANSQLRRRLLARPGASGIIAISGSRASIPGHGLFRANNYDDLQHQTVDIIATLGDQVSRALNGMAAQNRVGQNIIGTIAELMIPFDYGDDHLPTIATEIQIRPNWPNHQHLLVFANALGARHVRYPRDI